MRKTCLVIAALVLVATVSWLWIDPGATLAKPGEIGRYQTLVEGSRTRLFAVCFRLETTTGKAWRSLLQGQAADNWIEIEETEGAPEASSEIGRYQFAATYLADTRGQELAAVTRIETTTGKSWYVRIEPPRWRWMPIADRAPEKK